MSRLSAQISRTLRDSASLKLWRLGHYVDMVFRLDIFDNLQEAEANALKSYPFYRHARRTPPLDVSEDGGLTWTPIPPKWTRGWADELLWWSAS